MDFDTFENDLLVENWATYPFAPVTLFHFALICFFLGLVGVLTFGLLKL